ncbi:Protein CBG25441 [Caenorhabditis briggsae]|uniref:Protein CBG25441 n=1 Tax=Caenorhabditis briggsae TaxID=6238 RepID=B6ILD4_CAEBR|nr:Protein CBG25441 [Caenorhabditis briggsae]CAS00714.1 Protein CBG25441 [Caenorhabditis briggsae]
MSPIRRAPQTRRQKFVAWLIARLVIAVMSIHVTFVIYVYTWHQEDDGNLTTTTEASVDAWTAGSSGRANFLHPPPI